MSNRKSSTATDPPESSSTATDPPESSSTATDPPESSSAATDRPEASAAATDPPKASAAATDPIAEHVRWAVAHWPQIDAEVEGIVVRVEKIHRHFQEAFRASLGEAGLTKEEWKVLMALHHSVRSHGWLCHDLDVSTGAMTNRLDKLERRGLIRRAPDPNDRRGVLLELTDAGQSHLEEYVEAGAGRERELVDDLSLAEKQELNRLLSKLITSIQAKIAGQAPPRKRRPSS
jgi:DNA-binding MarR family transcriptional regulator